MKTIATSPPGRVAGTMRAALRGPVPLRLGMLLCLVALAGCGKNELEPGPPDQLTVHCSVDLDPIRVGDPVQLTITVFHPAGGLLEVPEPGREKEILLLSQNREAVPREDGMVQTSIRYSITSFRLGDHPVADGEIIWRQGDRELSTNFPPVILHVISALPDDASSEIADIKPVRRLPGRVPPWLWIVLGSAAAAFLAGLASSRLRRHGQASRPSAPPIPPHLIALKALQALRSKGLLERDECEPFYTELSLILRTYLDGRFHLNAPEETTEEIVEEMSRSPELSGAQRNILQEFMRQADMVKFAKGHPDRITMEAAFDTTRKFVEQTKRDLEEPESPRHPG